METDGFDELADLALSKSGQALRRSQKYLIEARLSHILRRESFSSLSELSACLLARPNPGFEDEVVAAMADKKTSFFQDRNTLHHIVDTVLPDIVSRQEETGENDPIQILCAGGCTGQEAYSLAILLDEADETKLMGRAVEILSIDMCKASTARGQDGLYGHYEIQMGMSVHRMLKYFSRHDDAWQISEEIRNRVTFEDANLMSPLDGLTSADVILCRNVLPNMTTAMAMGLSKRLGGLLVREGFLFLGVEEVPAPGSGLVLSDGAVGAWYFDPDADQGTAAA